MAPFLIEAIDLSWSGSVIGASATHYQVAIADLDLLAFVPRSRCERREDGQLSVAISRGDVEKLAKTPPMDIGFGIPPGFA
jgi:hypothetical protein